MISVVEGKAITGWEGWFDVQRTNTCFCTIPGYFIRDPGLIPTSEACVTCRNERSASSYKFYRQKSLTVYQMRELSYTLNEYEKHVCQQNVHISFRSYRLTLTKLQYRTYNLLLMLELSTFFRGTVAPISLVRA